MNECQKILLSLNKFCESDRKREGERGEREGEREEKERRERFSSLPSEWMEKRGKNGMYGRKLWSAFTWLFLPHQFVLTCRCLIISQRERERVERNRNRKEERMKERDQEETGREKSHWKKMFWSTLWIHKLVFLGGRAFYPHFFSSLSLLYSLSLSLSYSLLSLYVVDCRLSQ